MKPIQSAHFILDQQNSADAVFELLSREFTLCETGHIQLRQTFLDSFDSRMYRKNFVCGWQEPISKSTKNRKGLFFIHDKVTDRPICELQLNQIPKFSQDVTHLACRQLLEKILDIRALITMAVITVKRRQWLILNEENKTLIVFRAESYAIQEYTDTHRLPGRLIIEPVRGYQKIFKRVTQYVGNQLKLPNAGHALLDDVLAATAQKPDTDNLIVTQKLDNTLNTWEAVRVLLHRLFQVMQTNESGMRDAIDTEFLHDYRVAVRRIRSILSQIKHVIPDNSLVYFKREFSWLGAITTPTRDLDAYLLKFDGYLEELPDNMQNSLSLFRLFLERHWKIEHARMCRALDSKRYQKLMDAWHQLLTNDELPPQIKMVGKNAPSQNTYNATKPARDVAGQRIQRLYQRIIKEGAVITSQSDDEALHDLRKSCKKFRYLIEFFQDYYSGGAIDKLLKTLKQLQQNLGDFQDLCVQIEQLQVFAEQMRQEGLADTKTLMAMGVLVDKLYDRKSVVRQAFNRRFKAFVQPAMKAAFIHALHVHQPSGIVR